MITTTRKKTYVLNKIEGTVTIQELLAYAQSGVDTWISEPELWDLSNATMIEDPSDYKTVRATVKNIHDMVEKRKGKKTVFVAPDPLTYGMLRMAITIVESHESHPIASIFTDIEEALEWLKQD